MILLVLLVICAGYFMVILDTTVVNVALLAIQAQLGGSVTGLQWIVDGYALVFASFLLTAGTLGDRLGNKRVFLAGLVVFSMASALCGLAPTLWALEVARVVQGAGAALLVPASLALLNHTCADPIQRARAIGIWGAIAGIAAGAGPVIGGFLVNTLSWRSAFLVNVPVGACGFLLALCFIPATPRLPQRGFDLGAQVAGIAALGTLTLAIIEGDSWGWSSLPMLGAAALFVLAVVTFIVIERRATNPMLPLSLFSVPTFSAANMVGLLLNFGFYGQLFFISLFFQQVQGYSPLMTGIVLLPETGMALVASFLSGRVTGRVGPRLPMLIGLALGCAGFLLMTLVDGATNYLFTCITLIVIGFGTAFTMPAMTTAVIESAPKARSGIAAAVLNASRQTGGVLGVALLGSLVSRRISFVPGMHMALLIAGGAFLLGCLLSLLAIQRGPRPAKSLP